MTAEQILSKISIFILTIFQPMIFWLKDCQQLIVQINGKIALMSIIPRWRMTRRVCKKIAQVVAQPIFVKSYT
jgi:hypothetical protein